MDKVPGLIADKLQGWAGEDETIQAFITQGGPWHNGYVEFFRNCFRN